MQLVDAVNSVEPAILPPLNITLAPPFFIAVFVSVKPLTLLLPTLTVPKFTKVVDARTIAGTLGVGVAIGVGVGVGVGFTGGVGVDEGFGVGVAVGAAVGVGDGAGLGPT